jgi:hypothetical protein
MPAIAARIRQAFEIDHVLAQWNDECDAEERSCNTAEGHDDRIELVAVTKDENRRHGKHHARRCGVHGTGDRLHDVVFDDAFPPQHATENAESENRRQFGTCNREAENQGRITDGDRDDHTDEPADNDGGPGEFRINPAG